MKGDGVMRVTDAVVQMNMKETTVIRLSNAKMTAKLLMEGNLKLLSKAHLKQRMVCRQWISSSGSLFL